MLERFTQSNSSRVFINTLAQYGKTTINLLLSLYVVRLVLDLLGEDDYGIYILVAGVVSMTAFITNSLVTTTQRFISFYQGKNDKEKIKEIFNYSLLIHLCIGIFAIVVLESLGPWLFGGFLNIPVDRVDAARIIYQIVILILLISFNTAPFRALLVSHENIVYLSFVDIIDAILKLVLVVCLQFVTFDRLVSYAVIMLLIQGVNCLLITGYSFKKYEECTIKRIECFDKQYIKDICSFAGWSIYSTGCFVGRQQGMAIVLNKLINSAINAAYGIGYQVAGYTTFISASITNAISPQIIKSEAAGDRKRALWLSSVACKFSFFLLSALCIPCVFEIESILKIWLKEVPQHTELFCMMFLFTMMVDSLTANLGVINQAIGRIKAYSLIINTTKLLTLPLSVLCMLTTESLMPVAIVFVSVELLGSFLRLPFLKRTAGLDILSFTKTVFLKEIVPVTIMIGYCFIITNYLNFSWRFVVTFGTSIPLYLLTIYLVGLTQREKDIIQTIIRRKHE